MEVDNKTQNDNELILQNFYSIQSYSFLNDKYTPICLWGQLREGGGD